jgi:predicted  nucleic acid-binding Zn-ribbon protein
MVCRQCGKELPKNFTTNICLECSKENVRKIFKENPEIKDAFRESIEEMRKPENMKKMVDDTVRFMGAIQSMQKR